MKSSSSEKIFRALLMAVAAVTAILMAALLVFLLKGAWPALSGGFGKFLFSEVWNPVSGEFGALAPIYGTLMTSVIAVLIATPVGIGSALFLQEIYAKRMSKVLGFLIEMLAAVPSVIFGLWGFFVLAPFVREHIAPFCEPLGTILPFLAPPSFGVGILTAALVLALMVVPTITALARQIFAAIPRLQREAALALGATKMETIMISVLAPSKPGLVAAIVLAMARAIGETMAVTMVIGNRNAIAASLFAPGQSMASLIASEYAEASDGRHVAALMSVGVTLLFFSLCINATARLYAKRSVRKSWK